MYQSRLLQWSTLISACRDADLNTRAGLETAATVQTTIDALNNLCGPTARIISSIKRCVGTAHQTVRDRVRRS
jgi:hypothetical protein